MQLVFNGASLRIDPASTASNDHGRWTDKRRQRGKCFSWMRVTLDNDTQTFGEIFFLGVVCVLERRHRRTENPTVVGCFSCRKKCAVDNAFQIVVGFDLETTDDFGSAAIPTERAH